MSIYRAGVPVVLQNDAYSCSTASATWGLHALGQWVDQDTVEWQARVQGVITTHSGLQDARGYGLAALLRETYGVPAEAFPHVDWDWVVAHAGQGPLLLGGRHWGAAGHWSACRGVQDANTIDLANPAPGYAGVQQTMNRWTFEQYGAWSAVWIPTAGEPAAEEEDVARIEELEQQVADLNSTVGALRHDIIYQARLLLDDGKAEQAHALLSSEELA